MSISNNLDDRPKILALLLEVSARVAQAAMQEALDVCTFPGHPISSVGLHSG